MAETLLQVRDLKKYFKTPGGMLHAVDGITFDLEEGKTLGVVGESGCGKSTLGRVILGLLDATSGSVLFEGKETIGVSKHQRKDLRKNMQIIFQDPFSSLDPRKTVCEAIMEPLLLQKKLSKEECHAEALKLMDTVGLAKRFENSYPHELDGGRRQRIGIARALALKPKFIVCDEPISALDVSIQAQIINLMLDLQEEMELAYMFVTHDLSVVKYISDDIMVMYVGCTVEKCAAEELFQAPLHPYTKGLLSAIPVPNIHRERKRIVMQGELTTPIDPAPGCRFANRCPYAKERCQNEMPCYEEVLPAHFVACHYVREVNGLAGAAHA